MNRHFERADVAIISGTDRYPVRAPFDPPELYPERAGRGGSLDPSNAVYPMVREALRRLGMDKDNFGSPAWNPLGDLISQGHRVLIKPNFVLHFNAGGGPLEAVVTHPSILRAIADYVIIALGDRGEIIIGDAPQMNCDFAALCRKTGIDVLAEELRQACSRRGITFQLLDLRQEQTIYRHGIVWKRLPLASQASRPVRVRIGSESFMESIDCSRLYGADYARRQTVRAHASHAHEYVIASAALESDVVISVPKLKVHRKVGTTLNLKNMVGINTDKNHLAHYRVGSPAEGGDECNSPRWDDRLERHLTDWLLGTNWRLGRYPFLLWRVLRKLYSFLQTGAAGSFTHGNWKGNDTAWRMALDLNLVLLFADSTGQIRSSPSRRYFSLVDGITGGEGEGPLHPDAYPSGVILAGFNPLAVDWVATRLMGFDPARIPLYASGVAQMREWLPDFDPNQCRIHSNIARWVDLLHGDEVVFSFLAPAGWRGAAELYGATLEPAQPAPDTLGAIGQ